MLSYLLVLSNVTQHLLIISGVELNPGPLSPVPKDPTDKQLIGTAPQQNQQVERKQHGSRSVMASTPNSYQAAAPVLQSTDAT